MRVHPWWKMLSLSLVPRGLYAHSFCIGLCSRSSVPKGVSQEVVITMTLVQQKDKSHDIICDYSQQAPAD